MTSVINFQNAASAAVSFLRALPDMGPIHELRVEEIEVSDDGCYWLITLGFTHDPILKLQKREYKQFKVNATTGQVESMKIRTVA